MFSDFVRHQNWSFFFLRVALGVIFIIHGYMKWASFNGPFAIFQVLAVIEPVVGVLLILGLLTQLASLVTLIIMIGAIYTKITGMGLGFAESGTTGWEFDFVLLVMSVAVLLGGPGVLAMDGMKKRV